MSIVDKAALLAPRAETPTGMPEDSAEVPGFGTVRVRGLSWKEVRDNEAGTAGTLAHGMVDPVLTVPEAEQWLAAAPAGEVRDVLDKIAQLSGLGEGADKSSLPGDGAGSGDRVGALPGGEAGDDGRPPATGDAGG